MTRHLRHLIVAVALVTASGLSFLAGLTAQSTQSPTSALVGRVYESGGGTQLEVLFDGPRQNGDVDVAEITFPPGTNSGDHAHEATEIFYVLEGTLEHVVNGESHILTPGMLGFVNPPDLVNHIVAEDGPPAKALVIWAPGGTAALLTSRWRIVEGAPGP